MAYRHMRVNLKVFGNYILNNNVEKMFSENLHEMVTNASEIINSQSVEQQVCSGKRNVVVSRGHVSQ